MSAWKAVFKHAFIERSGVWTGLVAMGKSMDFYSSSPFSVMRTDKIVEPRRVLNLNDVKSEVNRISVSKTITGIKVGRGKDKDHVIIAFFKGEEEADRWEDVPVLPPSALPDLHDIDPMQPTKLDTSYIPAMVEYIADVQKLIRSTNHMVPEGGWQFVEHKGRVNLRLQWNNITAWVGGARMWDL